MQTLAKQLSLVALLVAVIGPLLFRAVSSPLILLILTPFLIITLLLVFIIGNAFLGLYLDQKRYSPRGSLASAARPLAFSTPAAWQATLTRSQWAHKPPQSLAPLLPDQPMTSAAINDILIMIVRDFVLVWYREISASPSFPTAVSSTLHNSLERLLDRAATVDLSAFVVKRILPKVTAHIEQFRQSEVALRGAALERRLTQSEELDLLLASRYAGRDGKLHPAINNLSSTYTRQTEEGHLKQLVEKALPFILPEQEAESVAVKIVVRELVACAVLYPITEMLSDPDFWNRTIDTIAGDVIRQQKMVSKVRNVLAAQSTRRPLPSAIASEAAAAPETITLHTDARHFETFLRSINHCSSLLDARRLKNDIMGEIRRTRTLFADHENEEWINGEKTEDVVSFLDRLYTAKRKVEQRIVVLGGEDDSRHSTQPDTESSTRLTLRDVLSNPSSLSYFMEFMDRRSRSLLVQFWLTVESFKNPLESVDSASSGDEDDGPAPSGDLANVKEDISMIHELYFAGAVLPPALAFISHKHVQAIRDFAAKQGNIPAAAERRVRRSVLFAQRQVEREMEHDFEDFGRSELWHRVVEDHQLTRNRQDSNTASGLTSPNAKGGDTHARTSTLHSTLSDSTTSLTSTTSPTSPSFSRSLTSASSLLPTFLSPLPTPRESASKLDLLMSSADDLDGSSRAPLFDETEEDKLFSPEDAQYERMEAIQAALSDIILEEQETETPSRPLLPEKKSEEAQFEPRAVTTKRRVLFEDEVQMDEVDMLEKGDSQHDAFKLAAPGDLQLSYEITRLGDKINHLESQDGILDTLIRKAELTGDTQELRLLRQSKSSLGRELRELRFQKMQYEQQESANRLVSDRTKVAIVNSAAGDENGKNVVRYLIEVQQLAVDGGFSSGWVVARRYNEFLGMHNKLRERYVLVKSLDFPGKRLVTALSGSFVDSRRSALEKYLQGLVAIPTVCESNELRAFLSRESPFIVSEPAGPVKTTSVIPGKALVRSVYKLASSIDDMFFGPSMLEVTIQRLTRQAAEYVGIVGSGVTDEDLVAQALKASGKGNSEDALARLTGDLRPLEGETSTSSFSAPICDLLLAVFELDEKKNWLRRQAIVIILQQLLGGTIERKLRDSVKSLLDESHLVSYITTFRDGLWPGGRLKTPDEPRTTEEKLHTRDEANRKLSAIIPDLAANMIGQSNARRGARRIFAVLQNRRLNQHIVYTIVDEVFAALFREAPP